MDFALNPTPTNDAKSAETGNGAGFALSSAPVVARAETDEGGGLPLTSGAPMFCLMARDPHTLFAYWAIDWNQAFAEAAPSDRKVHLRISNGDDAEQTVAVEPLAGSCYLTVENADAAYRGEIGYFQPAGVWNSLAESASISTPPEDLAAFGDDAFATVPFHLSFQRMVDTLREARSASAPILSQLAELRTRAAAPDAGESLMPEARELAKTVANVEASTPAPQVDAPELWRRQRIERILGFAPPSSPAEGFGGS